jgi:Fungal specific transcription factor domain/Fungal Zn(2)-Cys(6) binuclear cluster domain
MQRKSTDVSCPYQSHGLISAVRCQTCRKRKTRCSGERPGTHLSPNPCPRPPLNHSTECKTCLENGHHCLGYTDAAQQQRKSSSASKSGPRQEEDGSSSASPQNPGSPHLSPDVSRVSSREETLAESKLQKQHSAESTASVHKQSFPHPDQDLDQASEIKSPASNYTSISMNSARNRVPYFRYFGPTAIVPGFKQMVVQMKEQRRSTTSLTGDSPAAAPSTAIGLTPSTSNAETRLPVEIPFYDATDPLPNASLITHLCETFFTHLGCNYPFLQRERFLRDLEEKRVDAILVDAVCAVAARFSSHPLLSLPTSNIVPINSENEVLKAFRGHPFAQRAMAAVVDTFPCPTMAVAQACLLLAYEEFGSDHDSGLWMYLGTSIRMAQDLGMQKLEGMQLEGRIGPTPKTTKKGPEGKEEERKREQQQKKFSAARELLESASIADRRASEQERIDTFYCIFFLDRVVSSGTGRPVTLRDKDIEISFPYKPDEQSADGWPQPFPPLIRIVHLYGRVTDVLNNINEANQVTPETMSRLAGMEKDLTGQYNAPCSLFFLADFQQPYTNDFRQSFISMQRIFNTTSKLARVRISSCYISGFTL